MMRYSLDKWDGILSGFGFPLHMFSKATETNVYVPRVVLVVYRVEA